MIAHLHIATQLRGGITHLGKTYCTPPFKLANVREDKRQAMLQLMLMSSSPGVLDGDEYNLQIALSTGCYLHLQTQSYQRIFDMKSSAVQHLTVQMQNGSSFTYLPHPAVPHQNSSFTTLSKVYLSANCKLIWGEVLTCGRKLNGEVFLFTRYHSVTEVFMNDKLIIKENLLMQPGTINLNAMGQMEGYTHQASLICVGYNGIADDVKPFMATQPNITYGITAIPQGGILIRILGQKAEQLYSCITALANILSTNKETAYAI